jgi:threonine/homoserine/homoserine lactone efflux protein
VTATVPEALWAGILAGYAIAIPVGPIAVLIFDTGLRRGPAVAAAAGAGAASADGFYATVAGLVGAAVAGVVAPVIAPARVAGAALLAFIAVRGLRVALAPDDRSSAVARTAAASPTRGEGPDALRTYLLFLGLTIVNPMTFLYFGALMLGLPPAAGSEGRLLFVIGAFGASLSWQLLLAASGGLLHGRLPPRLQAATRVLGSIIVVVFAARLLLAAS